MNIIILNGIMPYHSKETEILITLFIICMIILGIFIFSINHFGKGNIKKGI